MSPVAPDVDFSQPIGQCRQKIWPGKKIPICVYSVFVFSDTGLLHLAIGMSHHG